MQIRGSISWSGSSPVKLPTSIPTLNTTFTSSYYCALKNTSTSSPKYRGLYHDSLILNQLVCLMTISFSSHLCNFARFPSFIAVLLAWNPNSESIELGYLFYLYEWKKNNITLSWRHGEPWKSTITSGAPCRVQGSHDLSFQYPNNQRNIQRENNLVK